MKSRIRELLVTDYLVVDHSETGQYMEEAHGSGSWKRLIEAIHGSDPTKANQKLVSQSKRFVVNRLCPVFRGNTSIQSV